MARKVQYPLTASQAATALDQVKAMVTRPEETPVDRESVNRIERVSKDLQRERERAHALALAYLADEPCPLELFRPWASRVTVWRWTKAKEEPLATELLNGKVCCRPSAFFRALKKHGRAVA
ncbi:MAG TPA: hypothetical protein VHF69_08065 [Candidatus Synoicihabitans sp.]|nr:hypothetical protein [Candidatus Synoicihabitans sp.]